MDQVKRTRKRAPRWEPKEVICIPHPVADAEFEKIMSELGQIIYEKLCEHESKAKPADPETEPSFVELKDDADAQVDALFLSVGLPTIKGTVRLSNAVYLCRNEDLVGFGAFYRDGANGLIHSIAVRPESQAKGYGRQIIRRLEDHAKVIGVSKFYAVARNSVGFFRKMGFREPTTATIPPKINAHRIYLRDSKSGPVLFKVPSKE